MSELMKIVKIFEDFREMWTLILNFSQSEDCFNHNYYYFFYYYCYFYLCAIKLRSEFY